MHMHMHKGLFICDLQAVWGLFGLDPDEVRARLLPDVVAEQAEMFLINGDMQSNLYTSSRAMHSAILGLLQVRKRCKEFWQEYSLEAHGYKVDLVCWQGGRLGSPAHPWSAVVHNQPTVASHASEYCYLLCGFVFQLQQPGTQPHRGTSCTTLCSFLRPRLLLSVPLCLQRESSSMSQAGIGKLQNLGVTVQRRWNNVLSDAHHQQIIEMFLGLRMRQYFPSVTFLYPEAAVPLEGESDDEGGSSDSDAWDVWFLRQPCRLGWQPGLSWCSAQSHCLQHWQPPTGNSERKGWPWKYPFSERGIAFGKQGLVPNSRGSSQLIFVLIVSADTAEDGGHIQAALKREGISPELINEQMVLQHTGRVTEKEAKIASERPEVGASPQVPAPACSSCLVYCCRLMCLCMQQPLKG